MSSTQFDDVAHFVCAPCHHAVSINLPSASHASPVCHVSMWVCCMQVPVTVDINGTTVNGSTCAVSYSLTETGQGLNTTDGDANYLSSLQLTLTNLAVNAPIAVPYTVTVNNTAYTGVTQSFGLNLTDSTAKAGVIAGSVPDYWNILWPSASNNITVSMLVQGSSIDLAPAQVSPQEWSWRHHHTKLCSV